MEVTLWMIDLNVCLHSGHSGLTCTKNDNQFNVKLFYNQIESKSKSIFNVFIITLLHSSKQLKQNWCIHESVKHLLLTRPKQMEQFGGGEWFASCRCWSSLLLPESSAEPDFFKNSRIRELVCGSFRAVVLFEKSICPSDVGTIAKSAIFLLVYFNIVLLFVYTNLS